MALKVMISSTAFDLPTSPTGDYRGLTGLGILSALSASEMLWRRLPSADSELPSPRSSYWSLLLYVLGLPPSP